MATTISISNINKEPFDTMSGTTIDEFSVSSSLLAITTQDAFLSTAVTDAYSSTLQVEDTQNTTRLWLNITSSQNSSGLCYNFNVSSTESVDKMNTYIYEHIFVPSFILTVVLFVIGILGNAVVLYVYFWKWRRTTSRIFILALAGFDLINCSILPIEMVIIRNVIKFDYPGLCKFSRWLTFTMNNCSSLTLVVIAIDRYIQICLPMKTPISNKQAKIWVAIAIVVSLATSWPSLVFYGTSTYFIPTHFPGVCIVGKLCLFEDKYTNSPYLLYFSSFLLVGNLVIDVLLICCYSKIIYMVIKRGDFSGRRNSRNDRKASCSTENEAFDPEDMSSQNVAKDATFNLNKDASSKIDFEGNIRKTNLSLSHHEKHPITESRDCGNKDFRRPRNWSIGNHSTKDKRKVFQRQRSLSIQSIEKRRSQMYRTTIMLLSITLLFIISFVPYCAIAIMRYLNPQYYNLLTKSGKVAYQFFLRTYLLSSALNPVIYSFLSEQFRAECRKIFRKILVNCGLKRFSPTSRSSSITVSN